MRISLHVCAVLIACGLFSSASEAQTASPNEIALARSEFHNGVEAVRAGNWEAARTAFERSYRLYPQPQTLLNLAGAQVEVGQLVAGVENYRRFLHDATGAAGEPYRASAEQAIERVQARIPSARITINGLNNSDVVRLDDQEVSRAVLGAPLPIDPGAHTLVVLRHDQEAGRQSFTAPESQTQEVHMDILAPASPPSRASPVPIAVVASSATESGRGATSSGGLLHSPVFLGVGVAVVVVVLAAVAVGFVLAASPPQDYSGNLSPGMIMVQ